ncbi:hypothetical protein ACSBR1_043241 [Camellia fascicularis]
MALQMIRLCKLKKLEELALNHNLFEGILPSCLSNLRSLKFFDISLNQFTGNISPSLFGSLNSPEYIDLSHNRFEVLFSFGSFANHSNLEVVELISGNDKFEVETEYTDWIPMFQLKVLVLSNCNLNKLSGNVLKFLLYQNKLRNAFEGGIPSSFGMMSELVVLDLSINNFLGELNDNQFTGPLTNVLSNLSNLNFLDISNKYMSGSILSSCSKPNLGFVELMHLQGNKFTRLIPRALLNSSNLLTFDIRENSFSGSIPDSIGVVSNLKIPLFKGNQLSDGVEFVTKRRTYSYRVGNILNFMSGLDLSCNKLTGEIPFELGKLSSVLVLNLSHNLLTRAISKTFSNFAQMESLELSYNSLS